VAQVRNGLWVCVENRVDQGYQVKDLRVGQAVG
jgi:hypothetical protein